MITRVRFHGRGGQGAKTASRILGSAAFNDGYFTQDFPIYGAERRGAPVTAFTRFSDSEITERGFIFSPDVSAVMDGSLITDPQANPFSGLRKGGVAIVNAKSRGESLNQRSDVSVVTLDLTGKALGFIGKPVLSAGIAAAAARVCGISAKALLDAVREETEHIGLPSQLVQKNLEFAKEIYKELAPIPLRTEELPSTEMLVPLAVVASGGGIEVVTRTGNSTVRHTGNWRTYRPEIDYSKCTDCMICYAYCPESAMSVGADGRVKIDYDNCKGCMICMTECPLRAISEMTEGGE